MKNVGRHFTTWTQRNALRDPLIQPDAKTQFGVTCLGAIIVASIPVSPEHEKYCVDVSCPDVPECAT
jgi:hypothetical protein